MKIILENLGVFKYAEYELADLNIICGENNSGKTYAMYALYGFLDFWRKSQLFDYRSLFNINDAEINKTIMDSGILVIPLAVSIEAINKSLFDACKNFYSGHHISNILTGQSQYFANTKFTLQITSDDHIKILDKYEKKMQAPNGDQIFQLIKVSGVDELVISILLEDKAKANFYNLHNLINTAIREILFDSILPEVFVACTERTGAVIFNDELDIQRNALQNLSDDILNNPNSLFDAVYKMKYPLPVRRNIDFIRKLKNVIKEESYFAKEYPEVLKFFDDEVVKGKYKLDEKSGIVSYIPRQKSLDNKVAKLTLNEASSSVRALLDLSFYLHYLAKPGQLLVIDEPELNLHPKSQRKIARLLVMLIKIGVKVFVATHSDYIIKELNTLIMLSNHENKQLALEIAEENGYNLALEKLDVKQVKVYISEKKSIIIPDSVKKEKLQTLTMAEIDPFYGIEAKSFDDTINEMNKLQRLIAYGV